MSNREALSALCDVRLSVSDWLCLAGWASAHVDENTPNVVIGALREISTQVMAQ